MKNEKFSDKELDELQNQLSKLTHKPPQELTAEKSYELFANKIPKAKGKQLPMYKKFIAVAAILAIFISTLFMIRQLQSSPSFITISTTENTEVVQLPDGSTITLAYHSTIEFPAKFADSIRFVKLTGEAFFDIEKDKEHPFIVQSGDMKVRVLGTQFNIKSYARNNIVETTLIEGLISISNVFNEETLILHPNQTAYYNTLTANLSYVDTPFAEDAVDWMSGRLIFRNQSLENICETLSNRFNVPIVIENDELKAYHLTARFEHGENLQQVLSILQKAIGFEWERTSGKVIIKPL